MTTHPLSPFVLRLGHFTLYLVPILRENHNLPIDGDNCCFFQRKASETMKG
jgi:hypothetical protein